jgi:hypothetical protein
MLRSSCLFLVGFTLLSATTASAQDPLLAQLYGSGVHAFFSGDYRQARENLSAAIDGGSQDPRAYYFRALCELRSGNNQDAADDFQKGAELEGADANQAYPVSKSIERIQGNARALLEKYRLKARVAAHQRKEDQRQMVYQKRRDADTQVLRQVGPPPSAAAIDQGGPMTPADNGLFGEAPKMTPVEKAAAANTAAQPAAGGAPVAADPFGAGAQGPPGGADPFAGAAPATTPPPAEPVTPAPPPQQEPVVEKPSTLPPAAGDADPFAEPPKTEPPK